MTRFIELPFDDDPANLTAGRTMVKQLIAMDSILSVRPQVGRGHYACLIDTINRVDIPVPLAYREVVKLIHDWETS